MKLQTRRGLRPRQTGNDPAHSFGPPRQGCGQCVDLCSAGEEGGGASHWAPGAGPRAGQNAATLSGCASFLALAGTGGEVRKGGKPQRRAWGRSEVVGWAESSKTAAEAQGIRGCWSHCCKGPAALCVCDGNLQMVPGSDRVSEAEPGPLYLIIQPGFPGGSEQPWGGAKVGSSRGGAGMPLPR